MLFVWGDKCWDLNCGLLTNRLTTTRDRPTVIVVHNESSVPRPLKLSSDLSHLNQYSESRTRAHHVETIIHVFLRDDSDGARQMYTNYGYVL